MVILHRDDGRVVLVRHTYGDRRAWDLPGGWVEEGEQPVQTARRETREELGADVAESEWQLIGAIEGLWHWKHERLTFFTARWPGGEPLVDPVEIAEVAWFDPRRPPEQLGVGTRAVLRDLAARRPVPGT